MIRVVFTRNMSYNADMKKKITNQCKYVRVDNNTNNSIYFIKNEDKLFKLFMYFYRVYQ